MCEFFFISDVDEIVSKLFNSTKKDNFLKEWNILTYYFKEAGRGALIKKGSIIILPERSEWRRSSL